MDKWFRSKWFVRIVSLAFAVSLFVYVSVEVNKSNTESSIFPGKSEEVQTLNDVPVGIRIDNDNYVVSGVPEFVTVSLKGSAGVLTPTVRQRNFDVYVDLKGLGEGDHVVDVEHANVPKELSVYIEPKTIEVTIEERATKEFQVNVDFINPDKMAAGFELGDYQIEPATITVTSSKSVIDQIGIVKVFVDVKDLSEPINKREVPVNVYDTQGNELKVNVEPENVLVSADVDNPSKKVPLKVPTKGELPEGYSLTSITAEVDEVEVYAKSTVLSDLEEISTEEIDLSDIKESGKIDASLSLPDGASSPGGGQVEVMVEVEQEQQTEKTEKTEKTKTIKKVPIDEENIGDEQEISFIDPKSPEMDITVVGNETAISELSADDFRILIDVDSLAPGEHHVPVLIEGPDDLKATGEFEEVTIEIT